MTAKNNPPQNYRRASLVSLAARRLFDSRCRPYSSLGARDMGGGTVGRSGGSSKRSNDCSGGIQNGFGRFPSPIAKR